ncbi:VOC family protein [Paenibacillus arenilitoris]|uniref:VOC family protein n=1 Tax=Paenibacillus arenilitoris TaxID=2772299 RepID=A0A927CLJ8_9BACL|nr:VOC family protein [Paenibacillus arenilitoris]MBD2870269.1 VOC family protein [Paenibacillus arenilitoris]
MQILGSYSYIPVSNLQEAARWYGKHLGLRVVREDELFLELRSASGVRVLLIGNDDARVTFHMNDSTGTQASYGFVVPDLREAHRQLAESGITVGSVTDYEALSFKFHDPDGNIVELWSDYPDPAAGWTVFEPLNGGQEEDS